MILVTGGRALGKRAFVEMQLGGGAQIRWVDGATAAPEEMETAKYCYHFQDFLRRALCGEIEGWLEHETQPEILAQRLLSANPGRVIVTDEIGCGIVPVSKEEREWREETGRVCCCLAAASGQVWRVVCGIGTRIK